MALVDVGLMQRTNLFACSLHPTVLLLSCALNVSYANISSFSTAQSSTLSLGNSPRPLSTQSLMTTFIQFQSSHASDASTFWFSSCHVKRARYLKEGDLYYITRTETVYTFHLIFLIYLTKYDLKVFFL